MRTKSFGVTTLQFALAVFLLVSGIAGIITDNAPENLIAEQFFRFSGMGREINEIISFIISTVEVICGVVLILEKFINKALFSAVSLILITIIWLFIMIVIDILGEKGLVGGNVFESMENTLGFLRMFATHLLVFGSIFVVMSE